MSDSGPKTKVTRKKLFVGMNKKDGFFDLKTIASTRDGVWDKIFYSVESRNAQFKRESAPKILAGKWSVVGFEGTFPFDIPFEM